MNMEISSSNKEFVAHACKPNFWNCTFKDKILKQIYMHSKATYCASLLQVFCVFLFWKRKFLEARSFTNSLKYGVDSLEL